MRIMRSGTTACLSGISQLAQADAVSFEDAARKAFAPGVRRLDIDLSRADFVDCGGVGALLAVCRRARRRRLRPTVRLLNPSPRVRRLIELTKLFPILLRQSFYTRSRDCRNVCRGNGGSPGCVRQAHRLPRQNTR